MRFEDVAALGCVVCGGDVDLRGQCIDCDAWIDGLEPAPRCTCPFDPVSMEYGPGTPCPSCIADEIAGAA